MRAGLRRQACGTGIGAYAPSEEEVSADSEPPTRGTRRPVYLTGVLVLALLFVLQLALASPGSAAVGDPCPQTGMETVYTDHAYNPGELVHVTLHELREIVEKLGAVDAAGAPPSGKGRPSGCDGLVRYFGAAGGEYSEDLVLMGRAAAFKLRSGWRLPATGD